MGAARAERIDLGTQRGDLVSERGAEVFRMQLRRREHMREHGECFRGELRRTGRRGVSLRATGAWDLGSLHDLWQAEGMDAVHAEIDRVPLGFSEGAQGPSRVMVHTSGFRMSPYADIKPAGGSTNTVTGEVARKLWHRSPGSAG